ncbi:MAG: hypothetical protein ACR2PG_04530 [Hyphomicrobiaceae bacterium]
MRYVLAMIGAVLVAAAAARFIGGIAATWVSTKFTYDSPDGQSDVEQMTFLGVLVAGLVVGWLIGWALGAPFVRRLED